MSTSLRWWQQAVFYQVYPRSFADGNGDGIGDFPGMIAKLDYLADLGIDAIWLSPHYPSPFLDCGYDISDYQNVAPEYGTLEDFQSFVDEAHARGIRVILDLVLNHTSDQHPWFRESRSSLDNPKRDWYIWRDGRDGAPPNNWASIFGGSAWALDRATGQYYYHAFLKEQPDLNWRNPELKAAMWETIRFWLDRGVDGFRLDAIGTIFEHPDVPNHPLPHAPEALLDANELDKATYEQLMLFQIQQPELHPLMRELRTLVDEYPGQRVLVGEDEDVAFYGAGDDELHLVFNFPLMRAGRLTATHVRANQAERLAQLPPGAWPCNTLGNHDTGRVWSQFGDGAHDGELARLHIALLLTLKGTPFLYNGEEIGMADLRLTDPGHLRDTVAIRTYRTLTERRGMPPGEAFARVAKTSRDRCRSPFQWSDAPNGGFSPPGVQTWLPVHPNHGDGVSVAKQQHDPTSLLSFYRRLLHLRRRTPALQAGDYQALPSSSPDTLAFLRQEHGSGQICLVVINFSRETQSITLDLGQATCHALLSSHGTEGQSISLDQLALAPFQVFIAEVVRRSVVDE